MKDIVEEMMKLWMKGENCARATSCSITEFYNENQCETLRLALTAFGGGIGEGSICGAITGSLAGMSYILGKKCGLNDAEIRERAKIFKENIRSKFESLDCYELISEFRADGKILKNKEAERRQKCTNIVKESVLEVQQIISNLGK